jgi:hypothetical protein
MGELITIHSDDDARAQRQWALMAELSDACRVVNDILATAESISPDARAMLEQLLERWLPRPVDA